MRRDYVKKSKLDPDEGGTVTGIEGFDVKHDLKPEQYGLERRSSMRGETFSAHDEQCEMILGDVEKMGKKIINNAELKEIQTKVTTDNDIMNKCSFFTTLLQYTKSDTRVKVTSGGLKGSTESYRVHKGRNMTMTPIMHRRMNVMNFEVAKNVQDIDKKLQMRKKDIRL